jgi:hypothetical protein
MTIPVPEYGGCLWPLDPACLSEQWDDYPEEVRTRAHALASSTLHSLTGGRVGGCPVVVRPMPSRGACFVPTHGIAPYGAGGFQPGMDTQGRWVNGCGPVSAACEVALPGPVTRLVEVNVDGVVLDPADLRIDNARLLVWQGEGPCPFPRSQDMSVRAGEPGSFYVIYHNTYRPDATAAHAAGLLAVEFAKACSGSKCRLPDTVTNVVRQGITYEVRGGNFPGGLTGIKVVDTFISLWNPNARRAASTVWSPDLPQHRYSTSGVTIPPEVYDGGTP